MRSRPCGGLVRRVRAQYIARRTGSRDPVQAYVGTAQPKCHARGRDDAESRVWEIGWPTSPMNTAPTTNMERFEREIGKYINDAELTRLSHYVTLDEN